MDYSVHFCYLMPVILMLKSKSFFDIFRDWTQPLILICEVGLLSVKAKTVCLLRYGNRIRHFSSIMSYLIRSCQVDIQRCTQCSYCSHGQCDIACVLNTAPLPWYILNIILLCILIVLYLSYLKHRTSLLRVGLICTA